MSDKALIRARFMAALAGGSSQALATQIANGAARPESAPEPELEDLPDLPTAPAEVVARVAQVVGDDLATLRTRYASLVGKKPFHGWSAEVLRQKIIQHAAS